MKQIYYNNKGVPYGESETKLILSNGAIYEDKESFHYISYIKVMGDTLTYLMNPARGRGLSKYVKLK